MTPAMLLRLSALMLAASTTLAAAQQPPPDKATLLGMGWDYATCSAVYAMLKVCIGKDDPAGNRQLDHKEDIAQARATFLLKAAGKTEGEIITLNVHMAESIRDQIHNDCDQGVPVVRQYGPHCEQLVTSIPGQ